MVSKLKCLCGIKLIAANTIGRKSKCSKLFIGPKSSCTAGVSQIVPIHPAGTLVNKLPTARKTA